MITFRPFRAIRPCPEVAHAVASRPYDVLDSEEAKEEAAGNSNSFLRVIKPEIDLPASTDLYSDEVYQKGRDTFRDMMAKGTFITDSAPNFYVYRLTMDGRSQRVWLDAVILKSITKGKSRNMSLPVLPKKMIV